MVGLPQVDGPEVQGAGVPVGQPVEPPPVGGPYRREIEAGVLRDIDGLTAGRRQDQDLAVGGLVLAGDGEPPGVGGPGVFHLAPVRQDGPGFRPAGPGHGQAAPVAEEGQLLSVRREARQELVHGRVGEAGLGEAGRLGEGAVVAAGRFGGEQVHLPGPVGGIDQLLAVGAPGHVTLAGRRVGHPDGGRRRHRGGVLGPAGGHEDVPGHHQGHLLAIGRGHDLGRVGGVSLPFCGRQQRVGGHVQLEPARRGGTVGRHGPEGVPQLVGSHPPVGGAARVARVDARVAGELRQAAVGQVHPEEIAVRPAVVRAEHQGAVAGPGHAVLVPGRVGQPLQLAAGQLHQPQVPAGRAAVVPPLGRRAAAHQRQAAAVGRRHGLQRQHLDQQGLGAPAGGDAVHRRHPVEGGVADGGEHHVGAEAAHGEVGGLVEGQPPGRARAGVQHVDVVPAVAARGEGQAPAVRQPDGPLVVTRVGRQALGGTARRGCQPEVALPGEGDPGPVGRRRRIPGHDRRGRPGGSRDQGQAEEGDQTTHGFSSVRNSK